MICERLATNFKYFREKKSWKFGKFWISKGFDPWNGERNFLGKSHSRGTMLSQQLGSIWIFIYAELSTLKPLCSEMGRALTNFNVAWTMNLDGVTDGKLWIQGPVIHSIWRNFSVRYWIRRIETKQEPKITSSGDMPKFFARLSRNI